MLSTVLRTFLFQLLETDSVHLFVFLVFAFSYETTIQGKKASKQARLACCLASLLASSFSWTTLIAKDKGTQGLILRILRMICLFPFLETDHVNFLFTEVLPHTN